MSGPDSLRLKSDDELNSVDYFATKVTRKLIGRMVRFFRQAIQ